MKKLFYTLFIVLVAHLVGVAKDRSRNESTTPAMTERAIAAGINHTLIIQEGFVYASGDNNMGQLGDGTTRPSAFNTMVLNLDHVIAVAAGRHHSMALRADGTVFVWGDNAQTQLGQPSPRTNLPIPVPGLADVIDIYAGEFFCLALKSDGTVIGWGRNWEGQLGKGFVSASEPPGPVLEATTMSPLTGITLISGGLRHSMAIQDGHVLAWGDNANSQLGNPVGGLSTLPVNVTVAGSFTDLLGVISLSGGDTHSMAIDESGMLWTWGEGLNGQLGMGPVNPADPMTFTRVNADTVVSGVRTMAAGVTHSLFVDGKGTLHFFGSNAMGQLGIAGPPQVDIPAASSMHTSVALAAGSDFSLLLESNGLVNGAGSNIFNQIDASGMGRSFFAPFFAKQDKIAQVANQLNSFVLKSDGTVWATGDKDYIGFTTTSDVATPTQIGSLTDIIAIGSANTTVFALDVFGDVWTWGDNQSGVCGIGSTSLTIGLPTKMPLAEVVYVQGAGQSNIGCSSGDCSYASAVDVNGDLYMWGNNDDYVLGDNTTTLRSSPVKATAAGKVFSTDLGARLGAALYADNTVSVWGHRYYSGIGPTGAKLKVATPMMLSQKIKAITFNRYLRMILTVDGQVLIWGRSINSPHFFSICQKTYDDREFHPSTVYEDTISTIPVSNVKFIETGDFVAFFIKADGSTWAWGRNDFGELGRGYTSTEELVPAQISNCSTYGVSLFHALSAEHHVLANRATNKVESWGANKHGEVGTGTITPFAPVLGCNAMLRIAEIVPEFEDQEALVIYPSPTTDVVNLQLPSSFVEESTLLRIIDESGRIVLETQGLHVGTEIEVADWKPGVYILEVAEGRRRVKKRFIVQ
ncbi:T9SS type A sorting domain-containing protein [Marinoscillum pacificum]|uniref:T9SS type A sorting domain-containing protein n=1 Tax=Marinoscillum pacificum TaxID=392723 RepID=UPI00215852FE|nr:T9SS type A sorting domain-containing protein [Marinoscillum pacificum]